MRKVFDSSRFWGEKTLLKSIFVGTFNNVLGWRYRYTPRHRFHNHDGGGSEPKLTHAGEILHQWRKMTVLEVQFRSK
jgi:hypothetical protein